ncbi:metallophosphoesterase [Planctomycetota bacterium]|nr:metallophosphoesterase [Planctomycetota bacterium]
MKIAHITDMHLRQSIPGMAANPKRLIRDMPHLLPKAIEEIKGHKPDIIVVTGDLVDVPEEWIEDHQEKKLCEEHTLSCIADYLYVKDILDASGLPYVVVAGNHDIPEFVWQVFEKFDDLIINGYKFLFFHDHETENHMPQRLHMERERFEDAVACDSDMLQVHVQHYVLTPTLHEGYPHSYKDDRLLTQLVDESEQVILSLSGHYHQGTELIHLRNAYFTTEPAFCVSPHVYRLYEIDPEAKHVSMRQLDLKM